MNDIRDEFRHKFVREFEEALAEYVRQKQGLGNGWNYDNETPWEHQALERVWQTIKDEFLK